MDEAFYTSRLTAEQGFYADCVEVHNLPGIFHYWSNTFLRPKFAQFGFNSPNNGFNAALQGQCLRDVTRAKRFISIGAGNCDLEIEIALYLRQNGHSNFQIDCLDVNAAMLERGRISAARAGVAGQVNPLYGDFNCWCPDGEYDSVVANQSLHHVLNLEHLFKEVKRSLRPTGSFIISDMIGRNGHQRWPEALEIVHQFWRQLPPSYRMNRKLERYEELYESWDCSSEGFEGIRSQDILPLLVDRFHFHLFIPFGNVIDPFVDRAFGPNFDAAAEWDRRFIEQVHRRDELELRSGRIKPTHMLAVIGIEPSAAPAFYNGLSPAFCVRSPQGNSSPSRISAAPPSAYSWNSWPHDAQRELEAACHQLAAAESRIVQHQARASELEKEVAARTEWALGLERDLQERTAWALRLKSDFDQQAALLLPVQEELDRRTAWALKTQAHLRLRTAQALRLESELEARTAWALRLDEELKEQERRTEQVQKELSGYLHNPVRFVVRLASGLKNRLWGAFRPKQSAPR